jgi:hypothetical protein
LSVPLDHIFESKYKQKKFIMAAEVIQGLGGGQRVAVKSFSDMTGSREISYTLTAGAAITNLMILPDAVDYIINGTDGTPIWQANVTFSCTALTGARSGSELAAFYALLGGTRYTVKGMRIKTTESSGATVNLDGVLTFQKTQIDGDFRQVRKDLSPLKENVGNGYSDKITVNHPFMKDEKTRVSLSALANGTSITVTLLLDAVNDAHDFTAIGDQSF